MNRQLQVFKDFIEQVEKCSTINETLRTAQKNYQIKSYEISQINAAYAFKLFDLIHQKFYKKDTHIMSSTWFQNELRLFIWCVFCYAHLKNIQVLSLGKQDWDYFSTIFNHKDSKLFQYQCHCLYMDNKGKNWNIEQQSLLKKIIEESISLGGRECNAKIKWNEISKQLFQVSNKKYLRSPKQCRERWNNHLDPQKIKGMWKREQCLLMFEYVKQHGKKWANIVKYLKNTRNEHSIKNKFNSLLKKQQKINKNLSEQEMYTQIIARIKSAIANDSFRQRNNDGDFDINDDQESISKRNVSVDASKTSNFTEMFMKKLMVFGNSDQAQIAVENKRKKEEVVKMQNRQKARLVNVPLITNIAITNRSDQEHKASGNVDDSQEIYEERFNEMGDQDEMSKENQLLDNKFKSQLNQKFKRQMFYEVQKL